ncbi:MAG TPA: hypothetical protein PLP57_07645 [Candidatus Saccharicenans sp.]|jgi:hypothetical protein|nr:hypothetical protein [Candidatus Saccharicenans sp.]HRD02495.1 hypothetical protein [Candidatus Saccharicenans sp.]
MKFEKVEFYAGGTGQEKPLAVYAGGERHLVNKVISKKRIMDSLTGRIKEVFRCRLDSGEIVKIEKELTSDQNQTEG